jgi:cardiolipin synthase A/B
LRPLIRKKVLIFFLISGLVIFYAWLIVAATRVSLPSETAPLLFYSNQTRQDIKRVLCKALGSSTESIFLSVYGISDPQMIEILGNKANAQIPVHIEYDPSASGNLQTMLPPSTRITAFKRKGLMHNKIAVVDHALVFLGSANFTTSSLRHHANLVLGLYSLPLAAFLEHPTAESYEFDIGEQKAKIFLLPDPKGLSLHHLLQSIAQAEQSIQIAMFTLTHPLIAGELIRAKRRGVEVAVALDYYTAKGASKKTVEALHKEGVKIYLSQGRELLHHKWAIFDGSTLATGSANWTKAAFSKNHDFLLFLLGLNLKQQDYLKKLWSIIVSESVEYNPNSW